MIDRYKVLKEHWRQLPDNDLEWYESDLSRAIIIHLWRLNNLSDTEWPTQEAYDEEEAERVALQKHRAKVIAEMKRRGIY